MPLCRLIRSAEVLGWNDLGQVEESARDRGHRNATHLGAVVGMDLGSRVNRQTPARAPAAAANRDIYSRASGGPQVPKGGSIPVAEESTLTAGKYGSHPIAL